MSEISWSDGMSVGVELLDSDHQVLMNLINSLAGIAGGAHTPRNADHMKKALETLVRYTKSHFGREEQVMEACGFPALASHHDEHLRFIDDVNEMAERVAANDLGAVGELVEYLQNWWHHHILIQDKAYQPYAENNEAANAAARAFPPLFAAGG